MNKTRIALRLPQTRHQGARSWRNLLLLSLIMALLGTAGCRTAPVKELNNQPVPRGVSMSQVGNAIESAGNSLGWAMKQEYPGMMTGKLFLRDHVANIEIPFSASQYSIRYKSSQNLKYNPTKKTIHSNYNGWVQNLDNAIRTRLASY